MKNKCQLINKAFRSIFGLSNVTIEQNINVHRLGRKCAYCKKAVIHRDSVSVCQCYLFAHKECLIKQLQGQDISECTVINCNTCHSIIKADILVDYIFRPKATIKDLIILTITMIICVIAAIFLINLKNSQQKIRDTQEIQGRQKQEIPFITGQQVIIMIILSAFGGAFCFTAVGIIFKKQIKIIQIPTTNIQIKVSAFEDIQEKIREESQQQILIKKQKQDF